MGEKLTPAGVREWLALGGSTKELMEPIFERLEQLEKCAPYAEDLGHRNTGDVQRLRERVENVEKWIEGRISLETDPRRPPREPLERAESNFMRGIFTVLIIAGVLALAVYQLGRQNGLAAAGAGVAS